MYVCMTCEFVQFILIQHKHIIYSRENNFKTNERPHQFYFKAGDTEISKNMKYSNLLHTY